MGVCLGGFVCSGGVCPGGGGVCPGGVCAQGGCVCQGGCPPGGGVCPEGVSTQGGKVMFSQASVILFEGEGEVSARGGVCQTPRCEQNHRRL